MEQLEMGHMMSGLIKGHWEWSWATELLDEWNFSSARSTSYRFVMWKIILRRIHDHTYIAGNYSIYN